MPTEQIPDNLQAHAITCFGKAVSYISVASSDVIIKSVAPLECTHWRLSRGSLARAMHVMDTVHVDTCHMF